MEYSIMYFKPENSWWVVSKLAGHTHWTTYIEAESSAMATVIASALNRHES